MRVFSKFKKVLQSFDYFATPQLLRYSEESTYSTATGGICSIFITVIFTVLFTIKKQLINYSYSSFVQSDPILTNISTYPEGSFMFAACIQHINLNDQRYFDVVAYKGEANSNNQQLSLVQLEPCTLAHFSMNPSTVDRFQNLLYACKCPPLNFNFQLQGSFSSESMKTFNVGVAVCNSTGINDTRPCVNQAGLKEWEAQYGSYTFKLSVVNPLINLSAEQYLTSIIEERLSMKFSRSLGAYAYIDFEDFTITTDQSILPYTDNKIDVGVRANPLAQSHRYQISKSTYLKQNTSYATFSSRKSLTKLEYIRSFNKIDSLLSYIGGLISIVFSAAFVLKKYTQMALQLEIGGKLYRVNQPPGKQISYKDTQENLSNSFNILSFWAYRFYKVFRLFGCSPNWKRMKDFQECREEIAQSINVIFLFERITYLERSIELMIEDFQFEGLHLLERQTITKASILRKKYYLKEQMTELRERQNERRYSLMGHAQDIIKFKKAPHEASLSSCAQSTKKTKKNHIKPLNLTDLSLRNQKYAQEKANEQQFSSSGSLSVQEQLDCKVFARIQENIEQLQINAGFGNNLSKNILVQLAKITHEVFDGVMVQKEAKDCIKVKEKTNKKSKGIRIVETLPKFQNIMNSVKHFGAVEPII